MANNTLFKSLTLLFILFSVYLSAAVEPFVQDIAGVSITVSDLDRSVGFYTRVLAFNKVNEGELDGPSTERLYGVFGMRAKRALLKLGEETVELVQYLTPRGRPIPVDSRSNDLWFQHIAIIVNNLDAAYAVLKMNDVIHASSKPQTLPEWNLNAAGIRAFYFKDPDNHVLEILQFPEGKGNPKWAMQSDGIFLGIDHTAIVVRDTEESLKFYRDTLGMTISGESENYGTEQEYLNNVFGARLRITTLHAEKGMGVELLEYLSPSDGRPYPANTQANDIWHWNTIMLTRDIKALDRALIKGKYDFISPGVIGQTAMMARDPDGHAVMFLTKQKP